MAKKQITIISGHDTDEERALSIRIWLEQHGVTIEEWNGLQVLTMKAEKPSEGQYRHEWNVGFDDPEGNQEQSYLVLSLEPDPYDTRIEVKYEGSYACTCKGRGCTKCNDELAAIERGENPYHHHTARPYKAPAMTISQDEAAHLNTFYSGIDA